MKDAFAAGQTDELEGWVPIEGAEFTVKVAAFEVAVGVHVPLTTHWYVYPFIPAVAAVMFSVAVVLFVYTPVLEMLLYPLPVFTCH